ncbi:MAG: TIGR00282 family metallophosphoesterase [Pseudomonadota bacterium]
MRILFLGDIVGQPGRTVVKKELPKLQARLKIDFTIANCENAAHGFGVLPQMCDDFFDLGIDVLTNGNHAWDRPEIISYYEKEERLLRPINFSNYPPGKGMRVFETSDHKKVLVINIIGRNIVEAIEDPFCALDQALPETNPLKSDLDAVIVDVHGERSSDKTAFGVLADGRATLIAGTHTHIPTADHRILPKGTGFQCDVGMCGDYDSVIGMEKNLILSRMTGQVPRQRLLPATGPATLCAVMIETDPKTGLCQYIEPIRVGASTLSLTH